MGKRKHPEPTLWDHNAYKKTVTSRTFSRVRNGNSLIIRSSHISPAASEAPDIPEPSVDFTPPDSEPGDADHFDNHENVQIPANRDTAESVGIKVKTRARYQNTVCLPPYICYPLAQVALPGCAIDNLGGRISYHLTR